MLSAAAALAAQSAQAAGGSHAVDDAAVETPGDCHGEGWVSDLGRGDSLVNADVGCTSRELPAVEIGASVQRVRAGAKVLWLAGPAAKWTIDDGPIGIALSGALQFDTGDGRVNDVTLIVPVTFPLARRVTLNVDLGGTYVRGEGTHACYGAQVEWVRSARLALMAEVHGRPDQPAGFDAGVRFTFDRGRADLDLLAGRQPGPDAPRALTLGLTVRR